MKKTLSVLLSAVMLFCTLGVMPFSASAEAGRRSGVCGDGVTYNIKEMNDVLYIEKTEVGTGKMYDYEYQKSEFYIAPYFYRVYTGEGVISIGTYTFYADNNIIDMKLPATLKTIGKCAFLSCESLTELECPENLSSIGERAFHNCYKLKTLKLNDRLKTIGDNAFQNCSEIETFKMGGAVTDIGAEAFRNCQKISEINIPSTLTTVGSAAFDMCIGLKSVNITDLKAWCKIDFENDLSNPVSKSQSLKLKGSEIKSLVIPSGITKVKPYAFTYCKGLTSVTVPEGVTSIGKRAFGGCSNVTKVTLPKSLKSIDENAFEYCSGIKDVYYNGSKSDWNKIKIGIRNISVTESKIHFAAPGQVKNLKLTKGSKQLKASWKKVSGAKGYQVRYSLKKNMKGAKTKAVKANKATVKSLKSGKTYYVQARAYKTSGGKKHYGSWSAKKKIKVG